MAAPGTNSPGRPERTSALHRMSAPLLLRLHAMPRWVVPILLAVLLVTGFALEGWAGALPLAVVGIFLGWLLALSWPLIRPTSRLIRLVVVAAVLATAWLEVAG